MSETEALEWLKRQQRWMALLTRLDASDQILLNRLACGDELKVAANRAGLNYDCARKRVKRYTVAVKAKSDAQLYELWRYVHKDHPEIRDETPTLIRHAQELKPRDPT